ncbi:hypothetical protein PAPYR_6685 [Paratrimastix pyriformis]|uniref:C2 domain-containing protein n=1 Tax=Paratrimastix pyriformis TaxID=342808 RepID=A0ABQ8ULV5_9EUKA|nr:hypothetical protein PAPYR_6685 [Paratrimastix pyriformis]
MTELFSCTIHCRNLKQSFFNRLTPQVILVSPDPFIQIRVPRTEVLPSGTLNPNFVQKISFVADPSRNPTASLHFQLWDINAPARVDDLNKQALHAVAHFPLHDLLAEPLFEHDLVSAKDGDEAGRISLITSRQPLASVCRS